MADSSNSLSDLMNDGSWNFNQMMSDDKLNKYKDVDTLRQENIGLKAQLLQANDQATKDKITQKINENDAKIKQSQTSYNDATINPLSLNSNNSLFDRFAVLDYAKYNRADPWIDYQKDGNNNFTVNNSIKLTDNIKSSNSGDNNFDILPLIRWSEKYPALQLRTQDFVYCKKLGYFPHNRLIVLRRFKNGVPDNLFDYQTKSANILYSQPISTLVTWVKPDEGFLKLDFKEEWKTEQQDIVTTLSSIVSEWNQSSPDKKTEKTEEAKGSFGMVETTAIAMIMSALGATQNTGEKLKDPSGNPNLIRNAAQRVTGGGGIKSDISFTNLVFEYELRYIKNVDPGIAMLDLISNCFRMGTSVSAFRLDYNLLKDQSVQQLINGEFQIQLQAFLGKINDFMKTAQTTLNNLISKGKDFITNLNNNPSKVVDSALNEPIQFIISRYREALKASIAGETGLPTGIWHVTIGNPKNPVVSCGDLIIENSSLELGKELGFNDFPNSFKYTISLKSARERGRDELERIFNAGRGRVYVYPKASNNPDLNEYTPDKETPKK